MSLAHSERVADCIRQAIDAAGGSISFAEFMQLALYAPGLGYYSAGTAKFGVSGDFVTAPETSRLFGRVLARQCAPVLRALPEQCIVEIGAGTGSLAAEMLKTLARLGVEVTRYAILEISPDLRQRQEVLVREEVPELASRVEWLDALPDTFTGIALANEVADALPVERFQKIGNRIIQYRVTVDGDGFSWLPGPAPEFLGQAVLHIEDTLGASLPDGYVSEVSTGMAAWIGDIAARIERGFVFLFDYGVTRREYYAADRNEGWLRCHFRHHAHNDPLIYPGIQDLSTWVDFTSVAEGATDAGMDVAGFVTQAQFLLHGGLETELADFERQPIAVQVELSRQVKMLTLPGEMGEHFKCMGLSRNQGITPRSFAAFDRTHTL
ncbi:MAG: SAM-dependent methyltransferase [Woeseia sp.]